MREWALVFGVEHLEREADAVVLGYRDTRRAPRRGSVLFLFPSWLLDASPEREAPSVLRSTGYSTACEARLAQLRSRSSPRLKRVREGSSMHISNVPPFRPKGESSTAEPSSIGGRTGEKERLRSYLAESARLSAAEIKFRFDRAATDFLACLDGVSEERGQCCPRPNNRSVAEVVEQLCVTIEDVAGPMGILLSGVRPPRPMIVIAALPTRQAPLADRIARLCRAQEAVSELLATAYDDRHTELSVSDRGFGLINWKAYATILHLQCTSHAREVRRILDQAFSRQNRCSRTREVVVPSVLIAMGEQQVPTV